MKRPPFEYSLAYTDIDGTRWTVDFEATSAAGALQHAGRVASGTRATLSRSGTQLCHLERARLDRDLWIVRPVD